MDPQTVDRQRYLLNTRFTMPMPNGPVDAISVTAKQSKILQALYAVMLQAIVLQLWALIVLAGMAIAVRRRGMTHNQGVANIAIWNLQSSPLAVIKAMFEYWTHVPKYALLWMILGILAISGSVLLSSFVSPDLLVAQAAPVNPAMVFVPKIISLTNNSAADAYTKLTLIVPASLRAVSALDAVNPATGGLINSTAQNANITFNKIPSALANSTFERVDWTYIVSGADFGIQYAPDLVHKAEGSCYTEYSWYQGQNDTTGSTMDMYRYSLADGIPVNTPLVLTGGTPTSMNVFTPSKPNADPANANVSFALLVSSAGRASFTQSDNPWYFTNRTGVNIPLSSGVQNKPGYAVLRGRPMLSCWQQDTWTYRGKTTSIWNLRQLGVLSPALIQILTTSLGKPRITNLIQELRTIALKSSIGSTGIFFDAAKSSLETDLQRLVLGSYIATKNVLSETTLFSQTDLGDNIENALFNGTNTMLPGAGDFIVRGTDFAALSIRVLAAVPSVLVFLHILVLLLGDSYWIPWPWRSVHAMNATVLYSNIEPKQFEDNDRVVSVSSVSAFRDGKSPALVRPKWDRRSSSYSWHRVPTSDDEMQMGRRSYPNVDGSTPSPDRAR